MIEDSFAPVVGALPEATCLVEGDGRILAANDAAGHVLRRSLAGLRGTKLQDLVLDEPEGVRAFLREASGSRAMIPGSFRISTSDGVVACRVHVGTIRPSTPAAPALLVMRLVPSNNDRDRFLIFNQKIDELTHEVRRRMQLEEERTRLLASEEAAREEAQRASRLKDEFLATLSHEMRTPLNAILGWASMIRGGEIGSEKLEKAVEVIYRSARSQVHLIDDLLDVSRIITGKLRLDLRPVELEGPVRAALDALEPTAEAKGVRLQRLLDPDPGRVSADPDRIQQVVWNLVSNGIKFTPRGGRVQVRLERVNSHVEIIVSDTGEGIEPEVLPYVFDRFRQAEGDLTRTHQGLGLGLSIVKHLVELHGGRVHVESEGRGKGASFAVSLPLLVYGSTEVLAETSRTNTKAGTDLSGFAGARLGGVRVLVVEDDPDSRELIVALFEAAGAEAVGVGTTAAALEAVEGETPDVLVSDIELVGEDGYMLVRKLRALPEEEGGRIPAVALTAFSRPVDRVRALEAGFQMHVHKPVEPAELVAVVASLVGRRGS